MRVLVLVVLHVAFARVALAGTAKCYAGIETSGDAQIATVIERDLDRDAREIRTRTWRANAPHRVLETTLHVAADDRTFAYDSRGIHGTGTLDGKPWAWTGAHHESKAFGGTVITDVHSSDEAFQTETRFEQAGHTRWRLAMEAKAFDCRDLGKRRAALDDSAPDAVRTCFEGTQTVLGDASRVVVEQIVAPRRIVIVTASPKLDNRVVIAIDGTSITASNGHSWTGTGTIDGKPGAWTRYSYRAHVDASALVVTGTLGGAQIKRTDTSADPARTLASLEAAAFDCAQLEARLATLTATP